MAKRFLILAMCVAFVAMSPVIVHAQGEDMDKAQATLDDFLQQLETAENASPAENMPTEESADIATEETQTSEESISNPLGAAGDLPFSGELPPAFSARPRSPAELQAAMEAEAAMQKERVEKQTFDAALKGLLPLSPDQVRQTLEKFKESREAAETPVADPEPMQVVETVSLDPGDAPSIIKMSPGHVTTVTILDASGAPWPIQDVSWAGKFEVMPPEEGGHVMRITPMSAHGAGNISIRLVDLITPITLSLRTGLDQVYYRYDARIPKPGPLAKVPIIEYSGLTTVAGTDGLMEGILDGTPSKGASRLTVKGADGRTTAYQVEGRVFLRTPLTLLSPAWDSSISSADGMNVYSLQRAPVILLSDRGRMVQLQVTENEVGQ